MYPRLLIAGLCLLLAVGCKKRPAPSTPAGVDTANVKIQPPPAPAEKDKKTDKDEPNWLKDDRFAKKDRPNQLPAEAPVNGGKQPWNVGAPAGGFAAPAPGVAVPPASVAGANAVPANPLPNKLGAVPPPGVAAVPPPAAPPTPAAAKKPVVTDDLKDVWTFVENFSGANGGQMPSSALTYAALVKAESPAAALVKDGSIILTGATARESVWAYETRAYTNGGLVASQNGVETLTAAQLQARLKK